MAAKKTTVNIDDFPFKLGVKDELFTMGSCFAAESAAYLERLGVDLLCNPFGTIYNLHSIYRGLCRLFSGEYYEQSELFCEEGLYFSPDHAARFDSRSPAEAVNLINDELKAAAPRLKRCTTFIITPGTSVVYSYGGSIVANCHKLPHQSFSKSLLTVEESTAYIEKIIALIKEHIPGANIIFTLSPIRHSPSNLVENSYSKAILRAALGRVGELGACYFPSYELVLDELRDYSCYRADGLHLKRGAVDYIMERFATLAFSDRLKSYIKAVAKLKNLASHRPKEPASEASLALLGKICREALCLERERGSRLIRAIKRAAASRLVEKFAATGEAQRQLNELFEKGSIEHKLFDAALRLQRGEQEAAGELKELVPEKRRLERFRRRILYNYLLERE